MRTSRIIWALLGWVLLILGGWVHNAHAQDVPSKDVGKSSYFIPVFPGGQVNVTPWMGNFRFNLPLFKTSGVGPCTTVALTYDSINIPDGNPSAISLGWQCSYNMRIHADPMDANNIQLYLPWGGDPIGITASPPNSGQFNVAHGFGFTAQIVGSPGQTFVMQLTGGTTYQFDSAFGALKSIISPTGNRTDFTFIDPLRPTQIVDMVPPGADPNAGTRGGVTTIEYYSSLDPVDPALYTRMKAVVDPAGNRYELGYANGTRGWQLASVRFPAVMVNGQSKYPTYKFQYTQPTQVGVYSVISKVILPNGADNGDYGYDLAFDAQGIRCLSISDPWSAGDPNDSYLMNDGSNGTIAPTLQFIYMGTGDGFPPPQDKHTAVMDRRGNTTVYVFKTSALGTESSLLSEIWDATTLSGVPAPGLFPILTCFDPNYNLIGMQDRWGNVTTYTFVPPTGQIGNWQKNLLTTVTKPGPTGPVMVESLTYTQDIFANVDTHTTWSAAGVPRVTTFHYNDSHGRLTSVNLPNVSLPVAQQGVTTQQTYDTVGKLPLLTSVNERGNAKTYSSFDGRHGLPQAELMAGGSQTFQKTYDLMGNVTATKLPQGISANDAPDWVVNHLDALFRVDYVTEKFNGVDVTKIDYEYDLNGNITSVKLAGDTNTPAQAEVRTYNKRGLLVSTTNADGTWTQKHDANGNVRSKTSMRGYTTTYTYDKINRKTTTVAPGASLNVSGSATIPTMTTTYSYDVPDGAGGMYDQVLRSGAGQANDRIDKTYYDNRRRVKETWEADGLTKTRFTYDWQDQLVAKEHLYNGAVFKTEVTFRDERDRVYCQRLQPDAYVAGGTPSAASDVVSLRNTVGTVVEERDPLWSSANPTAHRMVHVVDARERITSTTDGLGNVIKTMFYGDDDRLTEIRVPDPADKSTTLVTKETYTYTNRKELKEVFGRDHLVRKALNTYTIREGVIDSIQDAANVITQTTYYPNTWRVKDVTVAPGAPDMRKVTSTWQFGLLTQTQMWNSAGSPPGGYTTPSTYLHFYDQADRLELFQYPGGLLADEQYCYNAFSEQFKVQAGTKVCTQVFDQLGRLGSSTWSGPVSETLTRTYDELSNLTSIYTAVVPKSDSTQFKKWLGTPDIETFAIAGVPWQNSSPTLTYTYNDRLLLGILDKEGGQHQWNYDGNGRLQSTGYGASGQQIKTVNALSYTPGGLPSTTTLYNAAGTAVAVTTHTYDGRGRRIRQQTIHSTTHAVLSDLQWEYYDTDLIRKVIFTHLGVETVVVYNARREVISETSTSNGNGLTPPAYTNVLGPVTSGAESAAAGPATAATAARLPIAARAASYVIDAAGNRTSQTIDGITTTFTYNIASQVKTESRVSTQTDLLTHNYDVWGNEISRTMDLANNGSIDTTETYGYNYLNRLSTYVNSTTGANWQYDYWPSGERYSKTDATNREYYIPKLGDILADYSPGGPTGFTIKNKYVQGIVTDSKQLRIASDGSRRHYIGDAIGTVGMTLDDAAAIQQTSFKDVFGVQLAGSVGLERYSGMAQREHDTESGLDFMRARMYDPRIGRFTQTDPIMGNRATSHYAYASNNPVSMTDPSGLQEEPGLIPGTTIRVVHSSSQRDSVTDEIRQKEAQLDQDKRTWAAIVWSAYVLSQGQKSEDTLGLTAAEEAIALSRRSGPPVAPRVTPKQIQISPRVSSPNPPPVVPAENKLNLLAPYEPANVPNGSFSITEEGWKGYPAGIPRPQGPFRLLVGAEYEEAREAAFSANQSIREVGNLKGAKVDIHEVKPVKWGGDPVAPENKILISRELHQKEVTPWWNKFQRAIEPDVFQK